jgi:hypothetical protein
VRWLEEWAGEHEVTLGEAADAAIAPLIRAAAAARLRCQERVPKTLECDRSGSSGAGIL